MQGIRMATDLKTAAERLRAASDDEIRMAHVELLRASLDVLFGRAVLHRGTTSMHLLALGILVVDEIERRELIL